MPKDRGYTLDPNAKEGNENTASSAKIDYDPANKANKWDPSGLGMGYNPEDIEGNSGWQNLTVGGDNRSADKIKPPPRKGSPHPGGGWG